MFFPCLPLLSRVLLLLLMLLCLNTTFGSTATGYPVLYFVASNQEIGETDAIRRGREVQLRKKKTKAKGRQTTSRRTVQSPNVFFPLEPINIGDGIARCFPPVSRKHPGKRVRVFFLAKIYRDRQKVLRPAKGEGGKSHGGRRPSGVLMLVSDARAGEGALLGQHDHAPLAGDVPFHEILRAKVSKVVYA